MSEPVIKATGYQCPKCLHMAYERLSVCGPWMHCSFCDVDTVPLYGPDALVRVAIEMAKACGHADEKARDRARRNVDRLTKGDV